MNSIRGDVIRGDQVRRHTTSLPRHVSRQAELGKFRRKIFCRQEFGIRKLGILVQMSTHGNPLRTKLLAMGLKRGYPGRRRLDSLRFHGTHCLVFALVIRERLVIW